MADSDLVVVGAGLVGLATAYQALRARPGLRVVVLDKEPAVARHQSSHNSGVLHAGVYYAPGSLKARLCGAGKRELEAYAAERGVQVVRNGKLVVAVREDELPALARLAVTARANGVEGLRELDASGLREVEPAVRGLRALHSPGTAVVDFAAVAAALAGDVVALGGRLRLGEAVVALRTTAAGAAVTTGHDELSAGHVITCGGLQSDRLARLSGYHGGVRIVPFRGRWYELSTRAAALCRGHVYPVPDPRLPFLGVHVSRRVDGQVWAGPNAVPAGGREAYDGGVSWRDVADTLRFPGSWRLAARYAGAGAREVVEDAVRRAYLRRVQEYLPDVALSDLGPRHVGIRAQAVSRDGQLVDDFLLHRAGPVLHVLNAPSPAATSCLAIGRHLVGELGLSG